MNCSLCYILNENYVYNFFFHFLGLFFDPNDPTFTKWISPIFKLAPILKKILSAHVPIPLAITYGSTPKNGQKEVGYLQPAEIANFCEMWQKFMDFCQQQKK